MYLIASWMYNELQLLSHRHSASRSQFESIGDSRAIDAGKKTSDGVSLKTRSCHIQHCIYGMPSTTRTTLTHSLIHSPTHSLVHSLACPLLTHLFTHSLVLPIHSLSCRDRVNQVIIIGT